jgi:hypothetical protein
MHDLSGVKRKMDRVGGRNTHQLCMDINWRESWMNGSSFQSTNILASDFRLITAF